MILQRRICKPTWLQRGRARESAEMLEGQQRAGITATLQRGRARESAEIKILLVDPKAKTELQRGRARESAEIGSVWHGGVTGNQASTGPRS